MIRLLTFLILFFAFFSIDPQTMQGLKGFCSLRLIAEPSVLSKKSSTWMMGTRMYGTYSKAIQSKTLFVKDLTYNVGKKQLLRDVDLTLAKGDRVTIVGENGVGKSTFLRILSGQINDFTGIVRTPRTIGYLPQSFEVFDDKDVLDHIIDTSGRSDWSEHLKLYHTQPFSEWVREFNNLDGYTIFRALAQLGLMNHIIHKPLRSLSGGEKTKVHLCALMHQNPELLLLDEPTNHLDLRGIKWLENELRLFNGIVAMVTHDRALINNASTRISELSPTEHNFHHFTGGYDAYLVQQAKIRERLIQQRQTQEKEIGNLSDRLSRTQQIQSINIRGPRDGDKIGFNARGERRQKGLGRQVNSFRTKKNWLEENLVEIPEGRKNVQIDFGKPQNSEVSLEVSELSHRIADRQLFSNLSFSLLSGEKMCITGSNGTGKTTLLKILAGLLKPEKGEIVFPPHAKLGFLDQEQEFLDLSQTPIDHVLAMGVDCDETSAYELLNNFGVSHEHDINASFEKLSIGTRRKAQLAGIVASGANILLLDEPTNHLDIRSLEQIEDQLKIFPGIVIAVSHDRYFINKVNAREIKIEEKERGIDDYRKE